MDPTHMTTEKGCYFCNRCNNRAALDMTSERENMWKSMYLRAFMHEKRKLPPNQNHRGSLPMLLCTQEYSSGNNVGEGPFDDNYLVNSFVENQTMPWRVGDRIDAYNYTLLSNQNAIYESGKLEEDVMNQAMDAGSVRLDDYQVVDMLERGRQEGVGMFPKLYKFVDDSIGTSTDNEHVDLYVADRIVTDMLAAGLSFHSELGIVDGNDAHFPFAYDYAINVPTLTPIVHQYTEQRSFSQLDDITFEKMHNSGRANANAIMNVKQAVGAE